MKFGLKAKSRVCRGRHGEVGIVEFRLDGTDELGGLSVPDGQTTRVSIPQNS